MVDAFRGFRLVLALATSIIAAAIGGAATAQPQSLSDTELADVTAAMTRARIEAAALGHAGDPVAAATSVQILEWGALDIVRMRAVAAGAWERAFRLSLETDGTLLRARLSVKEAAEARTGSTLGAVFVVRRASHRPPVKSRRGK